MQLDEPPLFTELDKSQRILIAGAGGGFDIYAGVPLYLALRAQGKQPFLANLSFSSLRDEKHRFNSHCFRVTHETSGSDTYFPEKTLSQWFWNREKTEVPIYSFPQCGVRPLRDSYEHLAKELDLDAIVLIDGGTDSLMRGDESGLGTPSEDVVSLAAAHALDIPTKLLVCLGFGVDRFHGVCHAQFLEAVSRLIKQNAFLGTFSLLPQMEEAKHYLDLVQFSKERSRVARASSTIRLLLQ